MDPNQQSQIPQQTTNPLPAQTTQVATLSTPSKPFPKILIVIIIVVAMISIGVGGYILGTSKTSSQQQFANSNITATPAITNATPIPTLVTTQAPVSETSGFIKRNFDPNSMYQGDSVLHTPATKYPNAISQQILSVPENQLIGVKCSQTYQSDANGVYTYIDKNANKIVQVTDQNVSQMLNKFQGIELASLKLNYKRAQISYCSSEDGRTFVAYTTPSDPTNFYISIPHVGLLDSSQTNIQQLPMDKNAYGDCNEFIQLTKSGELYYRCDTGESDTTETEIYKTNIQQNTTSLLLSCYLTTSVPAPTPPLLTCK